MPVPALRGIYVPIYVVFTILFSIVVYKYIFYYYLVICFWYLPYMYLCNYNLTVCLHFYYVCIEPVGCSLLLGVCSLDPFGIIPYYCFLHIPSLIFILTYALLCCFADIHLTYILLTLPLPRRYCFGSLRLRQDDSAHDHLTGFTSACCFSCDMNTAWRMRWHVHFGRTDANIVRYNAVPVIGIVPGILTYVLHY